MIDFLTTSWFFWAFISSIFVSATLLTIEYFSPSKNQAVLWQGLGGFIVLLPLPLFLELEANWIFYAMTLLTGAANVYGANVMTHINIKHGSGMSSRIFPIVTIICFFVTLLFNFDLVLEYINNPMISLGILACIGFCAFCGFKINKCVVSKRAYIYALPALIALSAASLLSKVAFDNANETGAYFFSFFQGAIIGFATLCFSKDGRMQRNLNAKNILSNIKQAKQHLIFGLSIGILLSIYTITRNLSFYYTDNIGYPLMISLSTSFWIILFYKAIGRKENVALLPGFGIVVSAILLVYLTTKL